MAIVDVCLHSHELSTACVINWICKRSAAYIEDAGKFTFTFNQRENKHNTNTFVFVPKN